MINTSSHKGARVETTENSNFDRSKSRTFARIGKHRLPVKIKQLLFLLQVKICINLVLRNGEFLRGRVRAPEAPGPCMHAGHANRPRRD